MLNKLPQASIEGLLSCPGNSHLSWALAWQPDGPTLRFKELLRVIRVSRSKAYELMKSDPDFPRGIPLYDGDRSPKIYFLSHALAWLEARSNKLRDQLKDN